MTPPTKVWPSPLGVAAEVSPMITSSPGNWTSEAFASQAKDRNCLHACRICSTLRLLRYVRTSRPFLRYMTAPAQARHSSRGERATSPHSHGHRFSAHMGFFDCFLVPTCTPSKSKKPRSHAAAAQLLPPDDQRDLRPQALHKWRTSGVLLTLIGLAVAASTQAHAWSMASPMLLQSPHRERHDLSEEKIHGFVTVCPPMFSNQHIFGTLQPALQTEHTMAAVAVGHFRFPSRISLSLWRDGGTSPPVTKALTPLSLVNIMRRWQRSTTRQETDSTLEVGELTWTDCSQMTIQVHSRQLQSVHQIWLVSACLRIPASAQRPVVASAHSRTHNLAAIVAVKNYQARVPHLPLLSQHSRTQLSHVTEVQAPM